MDTIDYANEYLDRGFSVIPIKRETKIPVIKWKSYQSRQPSSELIEVWFKEKDNNIAIVTGTISGIYCIDCDSQEARDWVEKTLVKGSIYNKTSGDRFHLIVKIPNGITIKNAVAFNNIKGLDII